MSYFAFILVRDGESTLDPTLTSLIKQTAPPRKIVVVNDGSTDRTGDIADYYKGLYPDIMEIINTGSKTRDYTRLPSLYNLVLKYADARGFGDCDYYMAAAGDCRYEPEYAAKVLRHMEQNPDCAVASGDYGRIAKAPRGAGRFVRLSFYKKHYEQVPEKNGWESEMCQRALFNRLKIAVVKNARYEHLDRLGHAHQFTGFGYAMKALGYHPLYVLGRCLVSFLDGGEIGKVGALRILRGYVSYRPQPSGYYSQFDDELRSDVSKRQKAMMLGLIGRALTLRWLL